MFLINMNIFNLNNSLVINQVIQDKIILPQFTDLLSAIIGTNILSIFSAETKFFLPIILVSMLVGYAAYRAQKKSRVLYIFYRVT